MLSGLLATFKREDGIVLIDSDRCIRCLFCMASSTYLTRVINWEEPVITQKVASMDYCCETSLPQKRLGYIPNCYSIFLTCYIGHVINLRSVRLSLSKAGFTKNQGGFDKLSLTTF